MTNDISRIDKNFNLKSVENKDGMKFFNVLGEPFRIYGVFIDDGDFCRVPKSVAKTVSDEVYALNMHTAGGRIKFKTDSKKIAIIVKQPFITKLPHFALSGSAGFDLYLKKNGNNYFCGSFIPDFNYSEGFERTVYFANDGLNEVTINFPLYSGISELFIGIDENSVIAEPDEYAVKKPFVYYGSSITQGGCASRPGNSYQAIVSREFDCDYINLGFSGSAKAEDEIIEYIKKLDMSVFFYDYDHNAPSIEHLKETHEKGFKAIRKENPELPIVIMSRPVFYPADFEKKRFKIIEATYKNAVENGDKNVYLIDGKSLMKLAQDNGTVDCCHPNDMGFFSMAEAIKDIVNKII